MIKVFIVTATFVCVTIMGCQATGVSQDEHNELRKELKEMQEYISLLKAHYDGVIDKEYSLIKLQMGKTTKEMEDIWGRIKVDTVPKPKPPNPPLEKRLHMR